MNYQNYYYFFLEFIIKANILKKEERRRINNFLKEVNQGLKEINEENILSLFSKDRFLELHTIYISQVSYINNFFKEISYLDLSELDLNQKLDNLVELNRNLNSYQAKKLNVFILKQEKDLKYLISAYLLDKSAYIDLKEKIGKYKLLISYPLDVKEVVNKIFSKIESSSLDTFLESLEKEKKKSILDDVKEINISSNIKDISLNLKVDTLNVVPVSISKKLVEKLRKNKFTILGSPFNSDLKLINLFIKNGIDVIKFHINITHPVSSYKFKTWEEEKENIINLAIDNPNLTIGLVPGHINEKLEEIDYLELETYVDFIDIFIDSFTTHYIYVSKTIEKVVATNRILSKEETEALELFKISAIEASIINKSEYGYPLTLNDILLYSQLINNSSIPVIIPTQKLIKPKDIRVLYEIGAKGIALGGISLSTDYNQIERFLYEFMNEVSKL